MNSAMCQSNLKMLFKKCQMQSVPCWTRVSLDIVQTANNMKLAVIGCLLRIVSVNGKDVNTVLSGTVCGFSLNVS